MVLEILEKNSRFWNFFSEILNFLKILKIMSYNFQSRKQILTLRGVYSIIIVGYYVNLFSREYMKSGHIVPSECIATHVVVDSLKTNQE